MHRQVLAINEKLGHQQGMAIQYGNLGSLAELPGDRKQAREFGPKPVTCPTRSGYRTKSRSISRHSMTFRRPLTRRPSHLGAT
jgi:hypothetical protein